MLIHFTIMSERKAWSSMRLDLDDIGGAKELAKYRISLAKDDIEAASVNFDSGHYRASNNRAYYAIFRAI